MAKKRKSTIRNARYARMNKKANFRALSFFGADAKQMQKYKKTKRYVALQRARRLSKPRKR